MKFIPSLPAWWSKAWQQGLIAYETPQTEVEEPSILIIAMAMLGTLVCLIPLAAFVALTLDEDALIGMVGVVLGLLSMLGGLALLRRQGAVFQHCVGLVLWAFGSGLLLLNVGADSSESRAGWTLLCAIAVSLCLFGGVLARARWIQMIMGWSVGVTAYLLLLVAFSAVWWLIPLWAVELCLLLMWGGWLKGEAQRLTQATRECSQPRWAVLADAAVVGVLSGFLLALDPQLVQGLLWDDAWHARQDWVFEAGRWLATVMFVGANGLVLYVWHGRGVAQRDTLYMIAWMGAVLAVCAWFCPRIGSVSLFAALALLAARWRIAIFCLFLALVNLSAFYYNVSWTLAAKGIGMAVMGGALLLGLLLIQRFCQQRFNVSASENIRHTANRLTLPRAAWRWVVLGAALIFTLVNLDVYRKEQVILHGQRILVPLVPVDPRSLMQGDYMDLRFDLPASARVALEDSLVSTHYIQAQINGKGIATLGALTTPSGKLAADEVLLPLKRLKGRWVLVTDSYFFPEGQGERFERAKYGEFRVLSDGRALLVGLADENGNLIAPVD